MLAVGLILWIAFSWVYDLTTDGLQKTDDHPVDEESLKLTNKRLNNVIAGSVGFAILLLVVLSFWAGSNWNNDMPVVELKKVAVLPFAYQTDDAEEAYFKLE